MEKGKWFQKIADGADLSAEPLPGVPIVELAGDGRVLIEQHGGVTEYSREQISVKVRYGIVCICGCNLELALMTRQQLVIIGKIHSIRLQRRGG